MMDFQRKGGKSGGSTSSSRTPGKKLTSAVGKTRKEIPRSGTKKARSRAEKARSGINKARSGTKKAAKRSLKDLSGVDGVGSNGWRWERFLANISVGGLVIATVVNHGLKCPYLTRTGLALVRKGLTGVEHNFECPYLNKGLALVRMINCGRVEFIFQCLYSISFGQDAVDQL
ncbi:hypothetical protein K432DRAFT_446513 [Lepidopterella palustris CBS 459.81]|uniref:Uncharacterized protein n=1 Tax=Lepidopterella palustris CBS 459.81 TaxID=1314670 RepID=A0A8E2E1X6_9PEZI|nr:hypothetical protein K432DRAFT_446513 [Lepidopterella palustris CBS 459.81]